MQPADVLETFVGRDELREQLLGHLRSQRGCVAPRHLFLHGPRGIGKTTLLLVLRHTLQSSPGLRDAFDAVQFCEEERRIINLPSFAIRTLELWSQVRPEAQDDPVRASLARARPDPDQAFEILLATGNALAGKQTVFLIDNLDEVLTATISGKGRRFGGSSADLVRQLERFLTCPAFLVVGTAVQNPKKRREIPSSLLDLFEPPIRIEPLAHAMAFLRKRAERDRNEKFLANLSRFAARIDGLDRLAEGNPRLLAFLYDCLGDRPTLDLVEIVQRTVDDLTPMYQDILDRLLNRGQAATLEMLAVHGGVGRVKDIAELTYQDEQTVRTFLNDLRDLGLVVRHEDLQIPGAATASSARETVFRVHPPLFQIWYEMRHLQREESLFLVHFFSLLTDADEARRILGEARSRVDGQAEEIGSLFESVVDVLDPAWEDIRTQHVDKVLTAGGTLHDAQGSLSRAIEADRLAARPPRIGLLVVRSGVQSSLGDLVAAERDLATAEEIWREAPTLELRVKLHVARAGHLLAAGHLTESVTEAENAVSASSGLQSVSAAEIKALALFALAETLLAQGETRRAQNLATEGFEAMAQTASLSLQSAACSLLGRIHQMEGELETAESWFMQALELARAMGSPRREASSLNLIGQLLMLQGKGASARDSLEQALGIVRRIQALDGEARSLNHLGSLYVAMGDYAAARKHYEHALKIYRRLGRRRDVAGLLNNLGTVYAKVGDLRKAAEAYETLLSISQEIRDLPSQAVALINLGSLCNETGSAEKAHVHFLAALDIVRQTGDRHQEAVLLNNLGNTCSALGLSEEAQAHFNAALHLASTAGLRAVEAMCHNNLGGESLRQDNFVAASEHLTKGLSIAKTPETSHVKARLLANLASLKWQECRKEESLALLEQARTIFRDRGEPADLRKSSKQMASKLFQLAAESADNPEPWLSRALPLVKDIGAEEFLSSFLSQMAIPCLKESGRATPSLLNFVERLREHTSFAHLAPQMLAVEAFFRFYAAGRSSSELKDLGPAELFLARSLIDQIDRPLHAAARSLFQQGQSAEARKVLEAILDRSPDDVEALFNLASVCTRQNDFDSAAHYLERYLLQRPAETVALLLLAKVEEKRGAHERALDILRKAAGQETASPNVFHQWSRLLRHIGRFGELSESLRRWKEITKDPEVLQLLTVGIPEAELLAGETDRARADLPPESFVPEDPEARVLLGGLRVLFALLDGDAEAARRLAVQTLHDAAELPPADLPDVLKPDLLARAQELLGERDYRAFSNLRLAISQQLPPEHLDFLGESDLAEIKRLMTEEGARALQALQSGRIDNLDGLFRSTTRSLGPRAALMALGEAWPELEGAQQEVVFEMLLEALATRRAGEAVAALGALGRNFARLSPHDRTRSLAAFVDLASHPDTEALVRDQALGLVNVLYPNLMPAEREVIRPRLEEIRSRIESPALSELFRETIPAVEREPTP